MQEEALHAQPAIPLLIRPDGPEERSEEALCAWIRKRRRALDARLRKHGAMLFRGFDVPDAEAFERVALTLAPDLKNQYLGTSPRNAHTTYTFSASELPPHYPIMQHCEMSFLPSAPRRLFFCCTKAPEQGGETPLTDCAAVWADLDPEVREAFATRGICTIRNYGPPGRSNPLDPWQLKSWPEVFGTDDREAVEATAAAEGTRCEWRSDGGLRLLRTQPAVRPHPETEVPVWFNHVQVFHADAARIEYQRILAARPSLRAAGVSALIEGLSRARGAVKATRDLGTHCTFGDGGEIPREWIEHLLAVFWRHMVVSAWQRGDVLMIDNFRMSHGRLPYAGPREILVAFTEGVSTAA